MAKRRAAGGVGKTDWARISGYLFLLGVLISVVAGFFGAGVIPYSATLLVVLGTVVGVLTAIGFGGISELEVDTFILSAIALVVSGVGSQSLAQIPVLGVYLSSIISNITAFVAPALVIIAVEAIWRIGSKK